MTRLIVATGLSRYHHRSGSMRHPSLYEALICKPLASYAKAMRLQPPRHSRRDSVAHLQKG